MFDWITWGVWTLGFIILILWIWVPIKELRQMRRRMTGVLRNSHKERKHAPPDEP